MAYYPFPFHTHTFEQPVPDFVGAKLSYTTVDALSASILSILVQFVQFEALPSTNFSTILNSVSSNIFYECQQSHWPESTNYENSPLLRFVLLAQVKHLSKHPTRRELGVQSSTNLLIKSLHSVSFRTATKMICMSSNIQSILRQAWWSGRHLEEIIKICIDVIL